MLFPEELLPFELAHLCVVLAGPGGTQPRSPLVLFSAPCYGQEGHEEGEVGRKLVGALRPSGCWNLWEDG